MIQFFFISFIFTFMQKAREVIGWDQYFINVTREVATRSKDPSTQVGCVIVDQKHRPISFGYNGFLSAGDDSYLTWERPMKYYFSIHAEMNAILFAKRDLEGCKLYCSYACCENCLKFIIQAGIKEVVYDKPFLNSYTSGSNTSMSHPEAFEAATRLIQSAESLGFSMRNINGTSYLEEMWGGKDKIPDFREK